MSPLDLATSQKLCAEVRAEDKLCFRNAVMALVHMGDPEAVYVEGYTVAADLKLVVLHGWIERGDTIIDPTPIFCSGRTERQYFPGVRYSFTEVQGRIFNDSLLPWAHCRRRRRGDKALHEARWKAMQDAMFAAERAAYGEDVAERLRKFRETTPK